MDGGNKGGNFWHSLLGLVGIIPESIGMVANMVDAGIYFAEGNYAMAAVSLADDLDNFMAASTDLTTLGANVGCFVVGTTVKTEDGDKGIEEIEVGDKMLAYVEMQKNFIK